MLDWDEQLRSFAKADLREYGFDDTPMPSYRKKLNAQQIADLVSYLVSLQGPQPPMKTRLLTLAFGVRRRCAARGASDVRPNPQRRARAGQLAQLLRDALEPALQPARSRSRPRTRRTSSSSGFGRRARSRNSRRRRSSSTACSTPCRRRTRSSRSTPRRDASSGRSRTRTSADARTCCGRVNRGLAILGDTLFMGTIDAHLLAIDAKSGQLIWDTKVASAAERYSITMAPVVVKDKVHHRHRRRRHGHPRDRRGVRRAHRQGGVARPHDSRPRRDRQRQLVRRFVEGRRRRRLERGRLRPRDEPRVLRHRQSRARLGRPRPARRQPLQQLRARARRRHGQARVVLPIHAARRDGLRLDAGAGARGHQLARHADARRCSGRTATA